ncbi:hypothetical protein [Sphingomonas turrisvirgatae]|uniref:DUF2889 domain-containing protein n=1 Tax=Sphingomonas turrisvirgatae TaxID=1888892 RepID=A0A1E3LXA7_9SPHN|nr:hypothetical protein [Sphingomonas turrisvirgatae]ODP38452.1 hypothetical protein BFL28_13815 [Sphingomonas turrisvirgatae]
MILSAPDLYPGCPGLRRRILLRPGPDAVRGEVEDDFHHFVVALFHDRERITQVSTAAPRHPWTSCPAAGDLLAARLRGVPLGEAAGFDSPYSHCTHMLDLALLAAAHAHDDVPLLYSMFVADPGSALRAAQVWRGESIVLDWMLDGDRVAAGPGEGNNLRRLREWLPELRPRLREPATVLRRAIFISSGRRFDYEHVDNASVLTRQVGACFTFQPERSGTALPVRGSKLDFTAERAGPLALRLQPAPSPSNLGEED